MAAVDSLFFLKLGSSTLFSNYAPSTASSTRASRLPSGKHSLPPLWWATEKLILLIKDFLDNGISAYDSNDLILSSVHAFWTFHSCQVSDKYSIRTAP